MAVALAHAQAAAARAEVPIGAALFKGAELIAAASNTCLAEDNPLQHAEMRVLQQAWQVLEQQDFRSCTLFVTLEPCPMCMGAILHSHLAQLVFGAYNLKWGACGTVSDFSSLFPGQAIEVLGGIGETECTQLLATFFKSLRA